VWKFDGEGTVLTGWGGEGSEPGRFLTPHGIAVDENEMVYVADSGNHRIQKFAPDGTHLGTWGPGGDRPGYFRAPRGVEASGAGTIVVADTFNHRIQIYGGSGNLLRMLGQPVMLPLDLDRPVRLTIARHPA
jgi:DNA-binding beta-propeller fold protein YncE